MATKRKPHASYASLIAEAIHLTAGRNGSSPQAIKKCVAENHGDELPDNYETYIKSHLKQMFDNGELIKVRAARGAARGPGRATAGTGGDRFSDATCLLCRSRARTSSLMSSRSRSPRPPRPPSSPRVRSRMD
jgi:hypothetical protein